MTIMKVDSFDMNPKFSRFTIQIQKIDRLRTTFKIHIFSGYLKSSFKTHISNNLDKNPNKYHIA